MHNGTGSHSRYVATLYHLKGLCYIFGLVNHHKWLQPMYPKKTHLVLLYSAIIVACSSDNEVVQKTLTNTDWTLETILESDDLARGTLRLDTTWRLSLQADGRIDGDGFCQVGSGQWQSDDATLNIIDWSEEDIGLCSVIEIPPIVERVIPRLFGGETFIQRIDGGRLFLETGDNVQMVFSGRVRREGEQVVPFQTLARENNAGRAYSFGRAKSLGSTQFVVYRDAASLNADLAAAQPAEVQVYPPHRVELPVIDFDSSIVVGAYLPFDPQQASDVLVRGVRVAESGLEIEIAHYGRHVPDETSLRCGGDDAESAPWTLVLIDNVIEPVRIAEMARAYCSGVPAPD